MITEVHEFKTSDGARFATKEAAVTHEEQHQLCEILMQIGARAPGCGWMPVAQHLYARGVRAPQPKGEPT